MKGSYAGFLGCFNKGQKYDLPQETVKRLPKGCYKKCKPPWDEQKDEKAAMRAEAEAMARQAEGKADKLQAEAYKAKQRAKAAVAEAGKSKASLVQAEAALKQAKKNKAPKAVAKLSRAFQKAKLQLIMANAAADYFRAEAQLKDMEAEDAETEAAKAAKAVKAA